MNWIYLQNPEIENEIPTDLMATATLNTKATAIEKKIPHITYLAAKVALNTKAKQKLKVKYLTLRFGYQDSSQYKSHRKTKSLQVKVN